MSCVPKGLRRASMGTYVATIDGQIVVFRRDGRRGFIIELGRGSLSHRELRLRDAYQVAVGAIQPRIFDVMEEDDPAAPRFREAGGGVIACAS